MQSIPSTYSKDQNKKIISKIQPAKCDECGFMTYTRYQAAILFARPSGEFQKLQCNHFKIFPWISIHMPSNVVIHRLDTLTNRLFPKKPISSDRWNGKILQQQFLWRSHQNWTLPKVKFYPIDVQPVCGVITPQESEISPKMRVKQRT